MALSSSPQKKYKSLLGLAEHYLSLNPPALTKYVQCLEVLLKLEPAETVTARTTWQFQHFFEEVGTAGSDESKFEAASLIAAIFEKQDDLLSAKMILREGMELSRRNAYWHCRLVYQLAQIYVTEGQNDSACVFLQVGYEYKCIAKQFHARLQFAICKAMVLFIDKDFDDMLGLLNEADQLIDLWDEQSLQKELLGVYLNILKVSHFLMVGQINNVQTILGRLQGSINSIDSAASQFGKIKGDLFEWLPKHHLCLMVALLCDVHGMRTGGMDKAQTSTNSVLAAIHELQSFYDNSILAHFHVMVLENLV